LSFLFNISSPSALASSSSQPLCVPNFSYPLQLFLLLCLLFHFRLYLCLF
jgi:hypothetical protein